VKIIAAIYTLVFLVTSLWEWYVVLFTNPAVENLLPGFIFFFVGYPSSQLMESIVLLIPSLNNAVALQAILTTLGAFQVGIVWFVALRFKSRAT